MLPLIEIFTIYRVQFFFKLDKKSFWNTGNLKSGSNKKELFQIGQKNLDSDPIKKNNSDTWYSYYMVTQNMLRKNEGK